MQEPFSSNSFYFIEIRLFLQNANLVLKMTLFSYERISKKIFMVYVVDMIYESLSQKFQLVNEG
jgi:hypothetical protein